MNKTRGMSLHDIIVKRYKKGQLVIGVNNSSMLNNYARLSANPLIKLFHGIVYLYTFPVTIVGAIGVLASYRLFLYIGVYLGGLVALMALERYVSHKVTIDCALKNQHTFSDLVDRGIIKVRDIVDPDMTI